MVFQWFLPNSGTMVNNGIGPFKRHLKQPFLSLDRKHHLNIPMSGRITVPLRNITSLNRDATTMNQSHFQINTVTVSMECLKSTGCLIFDDQQLSYFNSLV